MADISDVTAYLAGAATTAVYPNGTSNPSVAAMDIRIFEGWPMPAQLDADMAGMLLATATTPSMPRTNGPLANVSVFPMLGNTARTYQIQDQTYVIAPPVQGLVVTVIAGVINVSGTPTSGEYLTVVADRTYAYSANGVSAAAIIATLAANFSANYSGVSFTSSTLTIPYRFQLDVRQGAVATLGKVVFRERQSVMVTVWAPNHNTRTALASAIDVAIKSNFKVSMPDTSQAIICYSRTNVIDDQQAASVYRRDLIYEVEYATVEEFPGYVVTTVNTSIVNPNGPTAIATALT